MKRLWILNHYAQEPGGAGGTRHFSLGENLKRYGWKTTVIAASVDHGSGRQRLDVNEDSRLDSFEGVDFLWVRTPSYVGNGFGRIKNMLLYSWRVVCTRVTHRLPNPDVVLGSSVHPFAALAGAVLAWWHRVPFLFEIRDLWPQTLVDMGRLREKSPITLALRYLERWLCRRAAATIVLLPRAVDYIVPLGVPAHRVVWIPNGVDLARFPVTPTPPVNDDFTFMYYGAHGEANGLENLLLAMRLLQDRGDSFGIRLRLIGDGPLKPELERAASDLGLRRVLFESPVPKNRIPEVSAEADAFLFNLIDAPVFRYGISSNKLFDFMAAGRPIIFCCEASNNPVDEAKAGLTVPPADPAKLADAMLKIARLSHIERQSMGDSARAYVERNHCFGNLARRLAEVLEPLSR